MARPAQLSVPFRDQVSSPSSVPKGSFSEPGRAPSVARAPASRGPAEPSPSEGRRIRARTATSITQPMPRVVAQGGPPKSLDPEVSAVSASTAASGVRPVAKRFIQGRSPWGVVVDEEVVLSPDDPRRER